MKLFLAIVLIVTFSSLVSEAIELADVANICENETLILNLSDSAKFDGNSIVSSTLRCIVIRSKYVDIKESSFENVPNLKYLDLRRNVISSRNLFSFGNISHLKILNLGYQDDSENNYNSKEIIISTKYPELEYLDLAHNSISDIRVSRGSENPFPNLTHLDLSGNKIYSPLSLTLPSTLTHFDLSNNRISKFSFRELNNLLSLKLDHNNINALDQYYIDFTPLENLENLSVTNNEIKYIRNSIRNLVSLRYLNLSFNFLSDFDFKMIEDLYLLEEVALDGNSIDDVFISVPSNITTLSLNCNRIINITASSFYNLKNLRRLFLSGNMIQNIHENSFQNQNLLEELYLDDNDLNYLPPYWCQFTKKLRYLNLSGNKFTSLESVLYDSNLPITRLYFERNPVIYINGSIISPEMTIFLNGDITSYMRSCIKKESVGPIYG